MQRQVTSLLGYTGVWQTLSICIHKREHHEHSKLVQHSFVFWGILYHENHVNYEQNIHLRYIILWWSSSYLLNSQSEWSLSLSGSPANATCSIGWKAAGRSNWCQWCVGHTAKTGAADAHRRPAFSLLCHGLKAVLSVAPITMSISRMNSDLLSYWHHALLMS